jgi:hypothetical protein
MEIGSKMSEITPCSREDFYRFGEVYCLHLLGQRLRQAFRAYVAIYQTTRLYFTEYIRLCDNLKHDIVILYQEVTVRTFSQVLLIL